jgi:hypothetical protein
MAQPTRNRPFPTSEFRPDGPGARRVAKAGLGKRSIGNRLRTTLVVRRALRLANTGALGSPAASPAFVLAQASAAKACTWLPMSRERQRSTAALASTLAASEARVRSIAARSRGFSPPSRRMTVIAAKRSPDGKRFASVSSRTDSEEPGRNEDPSFFYTSWRRCANEPPGAPRMSHKRMIAMRAGRELKRRSRALMWAQVRGLLRRRVGALGRS